MPTYTFPTDITPGDSGQTDWANSIGAALNTVGPLTDGKAPLDSPAFTGSPTAPTPAPGDNDTSIATTAFVINALGGASIVDASTTQKGKIEIATNTEAQAGTDATLAITPASLASVTATETRAGLAEVATTAEVSTGTDDARMVTPLKLKAVTNLLAPLANATLTGSPTAPTPSAGDNDTSIATTAFVTGAITTALSGAALSPVYVIYYDSATSTWKAQGGGSIPGSAPAGVYIRIVDKRGNAVADYAGAKWTNVTDIMPLTD